MSKIMNLSFDELNKNEQRIYLLLELREKIYKICSDDEIDDKLLEVTSEIAEELNVSIEKVISTK